MLPSNMFYKLLHIAVLRLVSLIFYGLNKENINVYTLKLFNTKNVGQIK
jgi:hypothetical protein